MTNGRDVHHDTSEAGESKGVRLCGQKSICGHVEKRIVWSLHTLVAIVLCALAAGAGAQTLTTLHSFSRGADGWRSFSGLVQGSDGYFYGTTSLGGTCTNCGYGRGTIFKPSMPLSLPANQISTIHVTDTNAVIAIPSMAGETYQLQYRDSLSDGDWSNVVGASRTNSLGGPLTLTDPDGVLQSQRFYRISVTP